jgi:hypothetical protein
VREKVIKRKEEEGRRWGEEGDGVGEDHLRQRNMEIIPNTRKKPCKAAGEREG